MEKNTRKIDFSRKRLAALADKYYNEGKYVSALRLAYEEYRRYQGDEDAFMRIADIYEGMGLHGSALNYWYKVLDVAAPEELPDVYESIAVNYMNLGSETQAAYYYNKLIEVDDTLPSEAKMEIAQTFSKDKRSGFRFTYPPEIADFSGEIDKGSRALKAGDLKGTLHILSVVEKGNKDYASAREMQAVAHLLMDEKDKAEEICLELLEDNPEDIRALATLSAVYLEQGRTEESRALALKLCDMPQTKTDDIYKVATVCCENDLHEQAYEKFCQLDEKMPYDGRMLYFKGVAAYKSGKLQEAANVFDTLCTIYPDAEVCKFYLQELRRLLADREQGIDAGDYAEPSYFYHLPQAERESRAKTLLYISNASRDEAELLGMAAYADGYLHWCFDELDGGDLDLQYIALLAAERGEMDEFIREVLLDNEVADLLKVETLRLLYERNREDEFGLVLCHIYRKAHLLPLKLSREKRKKFLEGYAKVASKFGIIAEEYAYKLQASAQKLYDALKAQEALDLVDSADDCACAIFVLSGIKQQKNHVETAAMLFDANADKVRVLLSHAISFSFDEQAKQKENTVDEVD